MSKTKEESSQKEMSQRKEGEDVEEKKHWGNAVQFILSAIGLAVGLGNIWRFPGLAYENGGSAFLIPYIICDIVFGLPVVYAEFLIGQYTQVSPAKAFYRYAPAFHGLGLTVVSMTICVGVFYAVVIGWSMLYLALTVGAQSHKWTLCDNWWNTENCMSTVNNYACLTSNASFPFSSSNGTCLSEPPANATSGAEEFFINYITPRSTGLTDFGAINWQVALCLVVLYILCAITNIKGIEILGKISYVTVPLPYIVVLILFGRGISLEGAWDGVAHYLFKPDLTKLWNHSTWAAALNQACFSLAIGMGALISLSSHNKKSNNCFRDACLVIFFDTFMSVIGGLAVFSTLGYLAKQTQKKIQDVVQSGPSLTFIVYPEAIATMPVPWLWNFLLFAMIFFLGFSSEVAIIEVACNYFHTSFPSIKHKWIMPIVCSVFLCAAGTLMTTDAGWYWFNLSSGFTAATGPCIAVVFELVLLMYVYGWKNVTKDLSEMWGDKKKSFIRRFFSRQSLFFAFSWGFVCPVLALVVGSLTLVREIPYKIGDYSLPIWAEIIGWFINLGPLLAIPIYFIVQVVIFKRKGISLRYLFRPSLLHPSHDRYYRSKGIQPPEGFFEEQKETSGSPVDEEQKTKESNVSA